MVSLPTQVERYWLSFLSVSDVMRIKYTGRRYHQITEDSVLIRELFHQERSRIMPTLDHFGMFISLLPPRQEKITRSNIASIFTADIDHDSPWYRYRVWRTTCMEYLDLMKDLALPKGACSALHLSVTQFYFVCSRIGKTSSSSDFVNSWMMTSGLQDKINALDPDEVRTIANQANCDELTAQLALVQEVNIVDAILLLI